MNGSDKAATGATGGPRQIILCCDGTNNTLTGGSHDTNVLKLVGLLAPERHNQLVYYDPGVGAPDQLPALGAWNELVRRKERIAGLAQGKGVYENIAEAYSFLVEHYAPGDQIYIFGFSRGAFTARCVAGMVNLFGIVRSDSKTLILTLIRVYFSTPSDATRRGRVSWGAMRARQAEEGRRENAALAEETGMVSGNASEDAIDAYFARKKKRKSTQREVAEQVRADFASSHGKTAQIHFIGVWDTVESVGIPLLSRRTITRNGGTRDKPGFRHIRHALSLDEVRSSFAPRLYWDEDYALDEHDPARARTLRQRWFRGVHSDVGGGYDVNESGLSDQALHWMLAEAEACGLRREPDTRAPGAQAKPYIAHDTPYDTPWWGVAGLSVRTNVTHRDGDEAHRIRVLGEGAALDPQARIYSVWKSATLLRNHRFWLALGCFFIFLLACGWLGHAALHADAGVGFVDAARQGGFGFDAWQRGFLAACLGDWAHCPAALPSPAAAAWAVGFDFGLIAAYAWLLGLCATWAFRQMAGVRRPDDPVPPVFVLGKAPLLAVLADVLENLMTLLTLWAAAWHSDWLAAAFGAAMLLANLAKWTGLAASLVLLACGILAVSARPLPAPSRP
ncbi:DUF2235 domain-containing protein [Massilia sp. Leaf139]|uniref:DUF2235 domain-containing protein n=1 Tax=Massilia sp. Leaf139 TaxID=1736272 RepID=UPI0006F44BEE|nr:DUF2235 domain-containing protein [Massilia sp. Leaf139]KQQ93664.1 hypothetical protein ASF77_22540 [Massilia sp. Leaf139]